MDGTLDLNWLFIVHKNLGYQRQAILFRQPRVLKLLHLLKVVSIRTQDSDSLHFYLQTYN